MVVVVGDVNSTVACALVARKLQIPVAHVESGLRSGDMSMPEEINRLMTDAIADLLYTTEQSADDNLAREGASNERVRFVGNTMIDSLLSHREKALQRPTLVELGLKDGDAVKPYAVVTLHRPGNVDHRETLAGLVEALTEISQDMTIVFPVHPRTRGRLEDFGLLGALEDNTNINLIGPQGYLDFMNLTGHASLVLSDSGGIQEEATILKVPCLTLRPNTERPVTITHGTNRLVGNDKQAILDAYQEMINRDFSDMPAPKGWDGAAAQRIAADIGEFLKQRAG